MRLRRVGFSLSLCLLVGCQAAPSQAPIAASEAMTRATAAGPARILVGTRGLSETACRELGARHRLKLERLLPLGVARYVLAGAAGPELQALAREPGVRYVEADAAGQVWGTTPNDPLYGDQWDMQRMHVSEAWQIRDGAETVVAVVDTGIDLAHPDLAGKIVAGANLTGPGDPQDDLGHGTAVAGIVGAIPDNGQGLIGVAPHALLMPVKVNTPHAGSVRASDAAAGLVWAADHGADVINLSLGFVAGEPGLDQGGLKTLHDAVAYALGKGIAVVCAAGNIQGEAQTTYPASWAGTDLPDLIAVGALDRGDRRSGTSNYGTWLTLTAPAEDIPALQPGGYGRFGGTSAAAPHVSGLAALLITPSRPPSLKTLRKWLTQSARDLGTPGPDLQFGAGAADALAAIQMSTR